MPDVSAPTVVPEVPAAIVMPLPPLGRAVSPVASVPMKLPEITVPVVPLSVTRMPFTALPEIRSTRRYPGADGVLSTDGVAAGSQADVDPVELLLAGQDFLARGVGADEVALDHVVRRAGEADQDALLRLPEITLRAAAVVPPTVLYGRRGDIHAVAALGTAGLPAALVPM